MNDSGIDVKGVIEYVDELGTHMQEIGALMREAATQAIKVMDTNPLYQQAKEKYDKRKAALHHMIENGEWADFAGDPQNISSEFDVTNKQFKQSIFEFDTIRDKIQKINNDACEEGDKNICFVSGLALSSCNAMYEFATGKLHTGNDGTLLGDGGKTFGQEGARRERDELASLVKFLSRIL